MLENEYCFLDEFTYSAVKYDKIVVDLLIRTSEKQHILSPKFLKYFQNFEFISENMLDAKMIPYSFSVDFC
jgi:hypothetical protein